MKKHIHPILRVQLCSSLLSRNLVFWTKRVIVFVLSITANSK